MKQRSAVMFKVIAFFFVACIDTCLYSCYGLLRVLVFVGNPAYHMNLKGQYKKVLSLILPLLLSFLKCNKTFRLQLAVKFSCNLVKLRILCMHRLLF